ncbi:hypothetical protein A2108_00590 [Candidatus Wolfebacteria bacterium GWA1_42_9]|uniref:Uncharacterized protein n=1 Tax=Candidatus Wolfebacteria bacterium GWA1_42_9 TaxID=1802553 RepID=A0A1F8DL86_9BACT|nr:MAG: hypothetical protein US39_C0020G0003 [Microgenomates group bacterium GW2011_GWC1_37_12b]KKT22891.1 MAG: hypothetical protein UW08_C0002G0020 [Parcubacteria group bacterium GW2011_GWB1_43_8b]OGM89370.1 MAG: hypothetical protein A2108_00590 [Candidatus Wolfebacteria bacterium GWA1_42_9]
MKKIVLALFFLGLGLVLGTQLVSAQEVSLETGVAANQTVQNQENVLSPEDTAKLKDGLDRLEIILIQLQARLDTKDEVVLSKKTEVNSSLGEIKTTLIAIDYSLETLSLSPTDEELAAQGPIAPVEFFSQIEQEGVVASEEKSGGLASVGLVVNLKKMAIPLAVVIAVIIVVLAWFLIKRYRGKKPVPITQSPAPSHTQQQIQTPSNPADAPQISEQA